MRNCTAPSSMASRTAAIIICCWRITPRMSRPRSGWRSFIPIARSGTARRYSTWRTWGNSRPTAPYANTRTRSGGCSRWRSRCRRRSSLTPSPRASALHRVEEVGIGLGGLELIEHELHGREFVHGVQQLPQDPHLLQLVRMGEQLFATRARAVDVDGGIDALLGDLAIEMDVVVARALELFVYHVVHARAGLDQRRGDDGERAAFFDIARGAEEAFRPLQRIGVDTAGEHLARCRDHGVVGARETRDRVEQYHHVSLVFHQTLGLLDHHFGNLHVTGGRLIEGGRDHLAAHRARHLRHLFGTFVDQQHDEIAFGMIVGDGLSDVLQDHGLAGLGRRHDHAALALADRRHQIDDARGNVLGAAVALLQTEALVGEQRRQILEQYFVLGVFGRLVVDLVDLQQREIALAFLRRPDLAGHGVARAQIEAADLTGRDIDVVGAGEIGAFCRSQKSEAILEDFQYAVTEDVFPFLGVRLEDGEDHILFARARHALDAHVLGNIQKLARGFLLEFGEIHRLVTFSSKIEDVNVEVSPARTAENYTKILS